MGKGAKETEPGGGEGEGNLNRTHYCFLLWK